MTGEDTGALFEAARAGDASARGDLLERLRPRLVLWAAVRMSENLKARVDPEDVVQEVLVAVHHGLDELDTDGSDGFMPWLFAVAENRIRDLVRYFGAKKREATARLRRTRTTPSAYAIRSEQLDGLRCALERLPEDYREIISLRSLQELGYGEIANRIGRSEGACRVLLCRALAALRDSLAGERSTA